MAENELEEKLVDDETHAQTKDEAETKEVVNTFAIAESLDSEGKRWKVAILQAGWSANGVFYSPDVLKAAVPLFEGVSAFAANGRDHSPDERGVRAIAGWFEDVSFNDNQLEATFHCADQGIRNLLNEAWKAHKTDLLGFSIRADAQLRRGREGRQEGLIVDQILEGLGIDIVMSPAAGGKILELLESKQEDKLDKNEEEVADEAASENEERIKVLEEALDTANVKLAEATQEEEEEDSKEDEAPVSEISEAVKVELEKTAAARQRMDDQVIIKTINESELPEIAQARLTNAFVGVELDLVKLEESVNDEKDYIAKITPNGPAVAGQKVIMGHDTQDAYINRMDATFVNKAIEVDGEKYQPFGSLREAYYDFTKENPYTGSAEGQRIWDAMFVPYHSGRNTIEEALATSNWGEVFSNRLNKRLLDEYGETQNQKWSKLISDMTSLKDLEFAHRRVRTGGYANFNTVNQQANYEEVTSPGDEEVTYIPLKYGGLDTITWEMVLADDLGAIRRIPTSMARAMRRTQNEFFFDFLESNATVYDGTALYDSTHGANKVSTPLSVSALSAAQVVMRSQTAFGEAAWSLGEANLPALLIIPNELEGLAQRIVGASDAMIVDLGREGGTDANEGAVGQDLNRFRGKLDFVVADWFTDPSDWFLMGSPSLVPTIEAGFLNGKDEPELWVQDEPTNGSMFTSDKITYKIRHVWGGAVLDWRTHFGAVGVS